MRTENKVNRFSVLFSRFLLVFFAVLLLTAGLLVVYEKMHSPSSASDRSASFRPEQKMTKESGAAMADVTYPTSSYDFLPDQRRYAFDISDHELKVGDEAGTSTIATYPDSVFIYEHEVSPDGRMLAYTTWDNEDKGETISTSTILGYHPESRYGGFEKNTLVLIQLVPGAHPLLIERRMSIAHKNLTWSPDGEHFAVLKLNDDEGVSVFDRGGMHICDVYTAAGPIAWKDNYSFGYQGKNGDLYLYDIRSKSETRIVKNVNTLVDPVFESPGQLLPSVSWSSDGSYGIFYRRSGNNELWTYDSQTNSEDMIATSSNDNLAGISVLRWTSPNAFDYAVSEPGAFDEKRGEIMLDVVEHRYDISKKSDKILKRYQMEPPGEG